MFEKRKKNFLSLLMTQLFTSKDLKRISAVSFFYSMSSKFDRSHLCSGGRYLVAAI